MGVTGLWTVLAPTARPVKLETLNKKRLAVDASIWIYQFLKAVRDKEGNALRNSHVVGFFRRICKLLFFGIKPVFVFDGGAPVLKRQTISGRKQRREGRREDAVRTAGKLLAVQMQRRAEEEEQKRKDAERGRQEEEEVVPEENLVYVDELQMTQQERQQSRKFKKKDAYHLPELDVSLSEMGQPNDPRIMSLEELEAYARQFDTGEDINVYDFSKIDYDSPFFTSLPASDRYNILNAARLRSRLRMGHSKEQLDSMFPDRMAFSKFQIERVTERNELTQRLMNINGMNDDAMFGVSGPGRIAGEKGREYVLVKNEGVEGGWALGVVSAKDEGEWNKPIDVEDLEKEAKDMDEEEWEDDDEFEDIPIEGLNRLPRRQKPADGSSFAAKVTKRRQAAYDSRRRQAPRHHTAPKVRPVKDADSLFFAEEVEEEDWENVNLEPSATDDLFHDGDGSDEELNRAIALSMAQGGDGESEDGELDRAVAMSLQKEDEGRRGEDNQDDFLEVFQQSAVGESRPLPKGSGRAIAHIVNDRATRAGPEKKAGLFAESDSDEDGIDLQAALAESRKTKRQPGRSSPPIVKGLLSPSLQQRKDAPAPAQTLAANHGGFSGPLPFEKLDLGASLLGKKKMQKLAEDNAGGFEKDTLAPEQRHKEVLPPWFAGNLQEDMATQAKLDKQDRERTREFDKQLRFAQAAQPRLRHQDTGEIIDLEAPQEMGEKTEVITLETEVEDKEGLAMEDVVSEDRDLRMADVDDSVHPELPSPNDSPIMSTGSARSPLESRNEEPPSTLQNQISLPCTSVGMHEERATVQQMGQASDEELYEWEESDHEREPVDVVQQQNAPAHADEEVPAEPLKSPSPDFETVTVPDVPGPPQTNYASTKETSPDPIPLVTEIAGQDAGAGSDPEQYDYYSDPEDEELFHQLAAETEEHARFASTLNHKSQLQNVEDYERELKQLRSQQRKDRRDADEVTHIMITECQQLLKLFGLPYITAPMEAEAQCAELVSLGLVDGIVTDDSDCFLFGGTRIYKNMFNQAKFVECYLAADLEKEFDLTRTKLISIAQLLGSDYTEGLPGIGPVTALEILSDFGSLSQFRDWWQGVQMGTIPKSADASSMFRKKFRKNATKLFLPPAFPDPRVEIAYLQPEVDSDPSAFQWGVPDLEALRSFLMATIGWTQERTDEVLVPVIRDMNQRVNEGTQSNITAFFGGAVGVGAATAKNGVGGGEAFAPRRRVEGSKRMGSALSRMAEQAKRRKEGGFREATDDGNKLPEENAVTAQPRPTPHGNGRTKKIKKRKATEEEPAASHSHSDDDDYDNTKKKAKKSTKAGRGVRGGRQNL
ncbi:DNA repair protein rad2 [Elasticomyces elasticus]|nr:DNA repair protein rad2 [Elasticomyces elasticus]